MSVPTYHNNAVKSSILAPSVTARLAQAGREAILAVRGDPTTRRELAIQVACLLLVTRRGNAYRKANSVNELMPEGQWFRSDWELWEATGGRPLLIKRLAAGGVIPPGSLGKWSPDFWHGLISSGAFKSMMHFKRWAVKFPANRPYLVPAIQGHVPFARVWANCRMGTVFRSMLAARMGADNPTGIGVLAGLIAGGRRVERDGESWIGFAWRRQNAAVVLAHQIPCVKVGREGKGTILVSPFWGALLATEMPEGFRQWFLLWGGRKGMCPLLPWAFIAHAWGKQPGEARWMVPFALSREGLHYSGFGIGFRRVRRDAFTLLGMSGVSPEVRAAWLRGLVARGVTREDFAGCKIPLDLDALLCHTLDQKGGEYECKAQLEEGKLDEAGHCDCP